MLSPLTAEEPLSVSEMVFGETIPGCGNQVHSLQAVPTCPSSTIIDPDMKGLMTWINSRSRQSTIVFDGNGYNEMPRQVDALIKLRKFLFPDLTFKHCRAYHGIMTQLPSFLQGSGDQAVVVMWRKNDKVKRVYAASIERVELDNFDQQDGLS